MRDADVSPLVGRSFVSKSNNVARIERMGGAAIRAIWRDLPSPQDVIDFTSFVESVIGPITPTISIGPEVEAEAYRRWKRGESPDAK